MADDEAESGPTRLLPVADPGLDGLAGELLAEGAELRAAFAADPAWPAMRQAFGPGER